MSSPTVRARVVRGLGAMAVLQVVGAAANLLTLVVLARLLTPRDFGIAAVASLVTALVGMFGDFGLGAAVVQTQDRVEEALYTASTLRLAISLPLFGVTFLAAPFAAGFFSTPEAADATRAVALLFILNSAAFIPLTRLSKELRFSTILRATVASVFASSATSISLAYAGFGYWSIVIASLVAAIVNLVAFRILAPWEIRFSYDRTIARDLLRYGKHLFLMGIFVLLILNLDNAAVAYGLGTLALGYYSVAFKWANVPVNFLSRVAAQVMMPAYVLLRESSERLRKGYQETVLMILSVSLPLYLGLLFLAEDFVLLFLGPVWLEITGPLRILCLMGIVRGLADPGIHLFMATGRSRLVSLNTGLQLTALAIFIIPGLLIAGLNGVALAVLGAYVVNTVSVLRFVVRLLGVPLLTVFRPLRSVIIAVGVVAVVVGVLSFITDTAIVPFVATVGAGALAYAATMRLLEGRTLYRYLRQVLDATRGA